MSAAARRWLEVRASDPTSPYAVDLLADALVGLGARAVEERDGRAVAYFEEPADADAFVEELRASLAARSGLGDLRIEHGWQPHEEWADTWKRGLEERRITDRIVVRPSWVEPGRDRAGDVVIELDPGMAFGTAEHGTTRGCLRLLDGLVRPGDRVLDVGAGSGILSIAAAALGADPVVAIEGDPLACEAMAENLERNGVAGRVSVVETFVDEDALVALGPADGIVANIETGLLAPLWVAFSRVLASGGWLVVSGILEGEWPGVHRELDALGFRLERLDADGEWRSGHFRPDDGAPRPHA